MEKPMFHDYTHLLRGNAPQLNYGVAVTDVDNDGALEFFVAGYGASNTVWKWDGAWYVDIADAVLADAMRQAIGVAAADIDGDGREEIYVLNIDSFAGRKQFGDRLFQFQDGRWRDLFSRPENGDALNLMAGRSVACVDRTGIGLYSFIVANYGGPMRCYEMDEYSFLADHAPYLGLAYITGGRSLLPLPLFSDFMDIFVGNEGGPNLLFRNHGDGTYAEVAAEFGVSDPRQHARGVAALDAGGGRFDIVLGNWDGPHRLFHPQPDGTFRDTAPPEMARPSLVRTVIAADFDNDGQEEIFFNNIGEPNRLFARREGVWRAVDIGEALEPQGLGTGAAVADLDGDGRLELLIAHGEMEPQPLSLYHTPENDNHWLRVMPLTGQGAPARGAVVQIQVDGRIRQRVVDAGSGYLCQMEPVAHFGLGAKERIESLLIRWPDGTRHTIHVDRVDQFLRVPYPDSA